MPIYVVIPVQIISGLFKVLVIGIVALPWWLLLAVFAALDWVLDWVFLLTFGLFCVPCAGFFIWILNVALLPVTILGWVMRFFLETVGLVVDGWMLLLGGSGCYMRWGHQCWFKRERSLRTILDIPLFMTEPDSLNTLKDMVVDYLLPKKITTRSEILVTRRMHRKNRIAAIPILGEITQAMDLAYVYFDM